MAVKSKERRLKEKEEMGEEAWQAKAIQSMANVPKVKNPKDSIFKKRRMCRVFCLTDPKSDIECGVDGCTFRIKQRIPVNLPEPVISLLQQTTFTDHEAVEKNGQIENVEFERRLYVVEIIPE